MVKVGSRPTANVARPNRDQECVFAPNEIADTPEENVCFGIQPYPHDDGFGECLKCFGNPAAKEFREQLGWAGRTFYDSRIEIVRGCLSPQKQKEFDELSYERKVIFIGRALERGLLI